MDICSGVPDKTAEKFGANRSLTVTLMATMAIIADCKRTAILPKGLVARGKAIK